MVRLESGNWDLGAFMKTFLRASVAALTLCAAPAMAADLALKAPPSMPAAAYDWSGFYLGIDAGWQESRIGLSATGDALSYAPHHDSFTLGGFGGV
jgi:opacity protein-like surface antigen